MSCAVRGCTNCRRLTVQNISFHRFPRDENLQKEWLKVLCIDCTKWVWSKNKYVCSEHFKEGDFISYGRCRKLKNYSIPSQKLNPIGTASSVVLSTSSSSLNTKASTSTSVLPESTSSSLTIQTEVKMEVKENQWVDLSDSGKISGDDTSIDNNSTKRQIMFEKSMYPYSVSPSTIAKKNFEMRKRQTAYRKKLYAANRNITRLKKKLTDMKIVVEYLHRTQNMSRNAVEHLEHSLNSKLDSVPHYLLQRYLKM